MISDVLRQAALRLHRKEKIAEVLTRWGTEVLLQIEEVSFERSKVASHRQGFRATSR